jgi:hypothetical protein
MLDFLKKQDKYSEEDFAHMVANIRYTSKILQLEVYQKTTPWSEDKIQAFIPIALHFTDFEWLDLIAQKNCTKDYDVIHDFLEHVKVLIKINEEKLVDMGDVHYD